MQALSDAENSVYDAQVRSAERVSEAQSAVLFSLDAASILPDGTEVFLAQDGRAYSKDGREIEGEELTLIVWDKDAPSWEAYQAQLVELEEAQQYLGRMNEHGDRLVELRDELENAGNPVTDERFNTINEEIVNGVQGRKR